MTQSLYVNGKRQVNHCLHIEDGESDSAYLFWYAESDLAFAVSILISSIDKWYTQMGKMFRLYLRGESFAVLYWALGI